MKAQTMIYSQPLFYMQRNLGQRFLKNRTMAECHNYHKEVFFILHFHLNICKDMTLEIMDFLDDSESKAWKSDILHSISRFGIKTNRDTVTIFVFQECDNVHWQRIFCECVCEEMTEYSEHLQQLSEKDLNNCLAPWQDYCFFDPLGFKTVGQRIVGWGFQWINPKIPSILIGLCADCD